MKNSYEVWLEIKERIKNSGTIQNFQYNAWIDVIKEAEFKDNFLYLWVPNTVVKNSIVSEGCEIYGTVENCVLFPSVTVKEGAHLRDSIIMADTVIGKNSRINYSIIDEEVSIGEDCHIGDKKSSSGGITVIAGGIHLKDNCSIPSGAMIDNSINQEEI